MPRFSTFCFVIPLSRFNVNSDCFYDCFSTVSKWLQKKCKRWADAEKTVKYPDGRICIEQIICWLRHEKWPMKHRPLYTSKNDVSEGTEETRQSSLQILSIVTGTCDYRDNDQKNNNPCQNYPQKSTNPPKYPKIN